MAKRLTDNELWQKDWFLNLNLKQKLLVKFIFDNCDCAGIYEISYRMLSNIFGEEVTKNDFLAIKQVKFVAENKIFIEDFIPFQYGVEISELNEKYSVHKGILRKLNKINYFETLNQPLTNPSVTLSQGLQDKDKDKDKDNSSSNVEEEKEIKKEKEKEEELKPIEEVIKASNVADNTRRARLKAIRNNTDLLYNQDIARIFDIYKQNCSNLIPIHFERRNIEFLGVLAEFIEQIERNFDYFEEVCKKANALKKIVNTRIDLKMLVSNHERIASGFFIKSEIQETRDEFIARKRKEARNDYTE